MMVFHHAADKSHMRFVEAVGWGGLCGVALSVTGLLGLAIGAQLYPQRYSQIPLEVLFVPFGFIVGFVLAATARLARPQWTAAEMFLIAALPAIIYGALMFSYRKANAMNAFISVALWPNPMTAAPCSSASCEPAIPPWQWTLQGTLTVQEKSGVGGRVDFIDVTSGERGSAKGGISGPAVRYGARQIAQTSGTNHVSARGILTFPLRYRYRTIAGDPRRIVSVYVQFTDDVGHQTTSLANVIVR